jgi:hypothetical protein
LLATFTQGSVDGRIIDPISQYRELGFLFIEICIKPLKKEGMIMATKKSAWIIFGIFVISAWVLGSAIQAGAETLNYKFYLYTSKVESAPVGDVEGHNLGLLWRGGFFQFENGEVAGASTVVAYDFIGQSGTFYEYITITFKDNSTIILKIQGGMGKGHEAPATGEIVKGTGRFEGIKGSRTLKSPPSFLPLVKGEALRKEYGEGTMTYTLPSK